MADDGSKQLATWPQVKFSFQVFWDGKEMRFQEITGLDSEEQVIEYRSSNSKIFSTVKMPGIQKSGNVILQKGLYHGGTDFNDIYNATKLSTIKKSEVTIHLLDESSAVTMTWVLHNAFPTKITGTDIKNDGDDVAIETMEFACEGMSLKS